MVNADPSLTSRGGRVAELRYQRSKAQEWRPEEQPHDTAPPESTPRLDPANWGVTREEGRDLLRRQMCPVCAAGPFKSPLIHTGKAHGFARFDVRDALGLTTTESLVDAEYRERLSAMSKGRDMSHVGQPGPRKRYRLTRAGRASLTANLNDVTADQSRAALELARTPEARAKQAVALREKWADATPEDRAAWGARVGGDKEHMDRMRAARPLRPCGTRASYRRGCHCDECRAAYLAYRKEHG